MLSNTILAVIIALAVVKLTNVLSYGWLKGRILRSQTWDLNICCGYTDGGGINADIVRYGDLPRFVEINDIYALPFGTRQFGSVLCSHTIEHVDDPERFFEELRRVGQEVTLVIPPLWDLTAAFNVLEHKHVFLTLRKRHTTLPRFVRLPLAGRIQQRWGQTIKA